MSDQWCNLKRFNSVWNKQYEFQYVVPILGSEARSRIVLSNSEFILQRFREVFEGCPVVGQISIAVKNQRAE